MWSLGVILYIWYATLGGPTVVGGWLSPRPYIPFSDSTRFISLLRSVTGFPPFAEDENWSKKSLFKQITGGSGGWDQVPGRGARELYRPHPRHSPPPVPEGDVQYPDSVFKKVSASGKAGR